MKEYILIILNDGELSQEEKADAIVALIEPSAAKSDDEGTPKNPGKP